MRPGNGHATMYINEEGKLLGLESNPYATALALAGQYGDVIAGPVVIVRTEMAETPISGSHLH